ncbi:MAG: type II toxin-antitoxin system HigB family toxin [Gemmataceae bacterium]
MVVIAISRLRAFWAAHAGAGTSLRVWFAATRAADWATFAGVRETFGNASAVGNGVVFNVAGNRYRLVTRVRYPTRTVFVLRVMTHAEYDDQERWQEDCGCHEPPPPRRPRRSPKRRP